MNIQPGHPIVVTGGSGFLGQAVLRHLLSSPWPLINVDLRPPSGPDLEAAMVDGRLVHVTGSLNDRAVIDALAARLGKKAWLVHLASRVDATREFAQLDEHFATHIEPVLNLLDGLGGMLEGVCFVSSIETYGYPQRRPIDERHPTEPFNLYGLGKLNAELLLRAHLQDTGTALSILRISHIYGPGEFYQKAIPVFIRSALTGTPVAIQGGGDDSRDYVHTHDVARAIELSIRSRRSGIFTISGGREVTISELHRQVKTATGRTLQATAAPRDRPALTYSFDLSAAREQLGYTPSVSFEEGLLSEVRWLEERINA